VGGHQDAEDSEKDVSAPGDVHKGWRDEVTESEVESPIGGGGECDSLAAEVVGEELWWIDPGDRAPGWRIRGNEEERAGDDCLRGGAANFD